MDNFFRIFRDFDYFLKSFVHFFSVNILKIIFLIRELLPRLFDVLLIPDKNHVQILCPFFSYTLLRNHFLRMPELFRQIHHHVLCTRHVFLKFSHFLRVQQKRPADLSHLWYIHSEDIKKKSYRILLPVQEIL